MPPKLNIRLSWIKKHSTEGKKSSSFEIKCRTAKLVTVQEIGFMFRMSKNQVGSSTIWGASIDISKDVSVDMSVVTQLTLG